MGELALRQVQSGIEVTRGTAVPTTRNLYGIMTITRDQGRRFADEARGIFVKHFRANPKLVDAGFKFDGDATFEDMPYLAEMFMQAATPNPATPATGYLYTYAPDLTSDLLKTRTFVAGDDTVQWQGAYGVADTADFSLDLNDAFKIALGGFVRDWVPVSSAYLTTGFVGGFNSLASRAVESVMGYQSRLFVDPAGGILGTTQVAGKFISAKAGIHLNNKRKPFGDGLNYSLQKLGRGLKDINCQITFEGSNQQEFADYYNNVEKLVRIGLYGSAISGTTFGLTNGIIAAGPVSSIVTAALTAAIPGGVGISVGGQTFVVAPAGAAAGALAIPVIPQTTTVAIASGATVMGAKTILLDFWGFWDNFVIGARDTNTTFQLNLVGVYDITSGYDHRLSVYNGLALANAIS